MLTCDEAEPELSAYLDGELNPQERAAVEAHMVLCTKCNDVLNEIEFARNALVSTPKLTVSNAFSAKLKEAIRADALKASSVVRAPSSHAIRAVQQVYELAEFGEPPPLVLVPARRVFPWSAVLSAIAAMLMVSLMGYVALAPSADQLAALTEKMTNQAKGDSHARFADRAPSGEPLDAPAKTIPPLEDAANPFPLSDSKGPDAKLANANAAERRSREAGNQMDAAPMRKSSASAKERLEESAKRVASKQAAKSPENFGEFPGGKGVDFGGAPVTKKAATDESPPPAAPPRPVAASPSEAAPFVQTPTQNRSAGAPKPGAAANGSDKAAMLKEEPGIGAGRRLAPDATLDLSETKAGGPMLVKIRTRDIERSNSQLTQLAKAMNADLKPSNVAGKAQTEFSLSAPALKRTELLNALFAMQADGAKVASAPSAKDEPGAGEERPTGAEKTDKPSRVTAEKSKAAVEEKGEEKFTVKVELIAE